MKIYSFSPFANEHSKILILGTMPGNDSLKFNQYYAHPQNAFWKILFSLMNKPFSQNYDERRKLLLDNRIALWDVLKSCERKGSSADSDISNEKPNDIKKLLNEHPSIQHIFFNGKQAEKFFKKYSNNVTISTSVLPSSSPANAISINRKLDEWKIIEKHIK